jgi:hypothetical protein
MDIYWYSAKLTPMLLVVILAHTKFYKASKVFGLPLMQKHIASYI